MDTSGVERRHRDPQLLRDMQNAIEEHENKEVIDAPAFTEELSKQEMLDHLVDYHNLDGVRVAGHVLRKSGCKATKAELVVYHDNLHTRQDNPNARVDYNRRVPKRDDAGKMLIENGNYHYVHTFWLGGAPFPKVRHRHTAITLTAQQRDAVAAVRNNERASAGVLSVRDRKTLTELVNNDFNSLKQEMRAFASDSLAQKVAEINADWDARESKIPDFATQATEMHRKHAQEQTELRVRQQQEIRELSQKHEDAFKAVTDKAEEKGVTLQQTQERVLAEDGKTWQQRTVFKATVQGRKDALAGAERENKTFLDRALLTLEKQRLTAQRQVLLSGVPNEAMPIVESIPDARTLMVEAQQEHEAKQLS